MDTLKDGSLEVASQIGYEFELLYPNRGSHANYLHHVDFCIDLNSYVAAALNGTKTFRNPKTNTNQTCYLVNEQITSISRDLVYFRRTYAPEFADVVSYGSADFVKQDLSGLKSGTLYAATFDAKQTVTYSGRKEIQSVGSLEDIVVLSGSVTNPEPSGMLEFSSFAAVDLSGTAAQIEEGIGSASIRGVVKDSNSVRVNTVYDDFSAHSINVTGAASAFSITETEATGASYFVIEFSGASGKVAGTVVVKDSAATPNLEEPHAPQTIPWDGFTFLSLASWQFGADDVGPTGDKRYALLHYGDGDRQPAVGYNRVDLGSVSVPFSVDIFIPSGSPITGMGFTFDGNTYPIRTTTKGSWVTLSGTTTASNIAIGDCDSAGNAVGKLNASWVIGVSNLQFGHSSISSDLTQDGSVIQSDLTSYISSVSKSSSSLTLTTRHFPASNYSVEVIGLSDADNYSVSTSGNDITIDFSDVANVLSTQQQPTAIRSLQVNGHGITEVGTRIPIYKGEELVSTTSVSVITDANNIMVPLEDIPGADFQATHIGDPATAAVYDLAIVRAPSRITSAFFIPGVTMGVSSPDDIPVIEGDESAANQLAAIANADTYLQVSSSDLEQLFQGLYVRTVQEVKRVDVFG